MKWRSVCNTRHRAEHIELLSWSACQRTAPHWHPCLNPKFSKAYLLVIGKKGLFISPAFKKDTQIHITHALARPCHMSCIQGLTHTNPQASDSERGRTSHVTLRGPRRPAHRHGHCYWGNVSTSVSTCSLCSAVPIQGSFNGLLLAACQRR